MANKIDNLLELSSQFALTLLSILLVMATSSYLAVAQDQQSPSKDRDNPTALTSAEIKGDGVDSKTEYFYAFTTGPGEVKLTLDVKAEKDTAVSSVDIALFDASSRKLLSTYANPDHGSSKRAVETVKVRGEQTLLLDVTISQGVDNFKIRLDGAIKIAPSTSGTTNLSTTGGNGTAADSAQQSQTADSTTTGGSSSAAAPAASASATTTASQEASASQPSDATSASQAGAVVSDLPGKEGKADAKINSVGAALNSIISGASSTANSVKAVKKKKNAHATFKSNFTPPATNATGNSANAQPTLLIDSFKVGAYSTPLTASGGTNIQTGEERELLGGSRSIYLAILNPDAQPVSLQVLTSKPALVVNAGYHAVPSLQLAYKVPPVSADLLSKYDRFLIDFGGLDHGVNLNVVVYGADKKVDGHTGEVCKVLAPDGPFTLSFPFARLGAPEVLKQTNTIVFEFQATSWGLDYAITRITSEKGDPIGKHIVACSK